MLYDNSLSFNEFLIREQHPAGMIQDAIFTFLENRDDVVVYGAHAVNAYVSERRNTEDVDMYSTDAANFAEALRLHIHSTFRIAVRVRNVADGKGFRIYQLREPENRHLADIRQIDALPPSRRIQNILVVEPLELIAQKMIAFVARKGLAKAGTDYRDLVSLLIRFPKFKVVDGEVWKRLNVVGASSAVLAAWDELVSSEFRTEQDEDLTY